MAELFSSVVAVDAEALMARRLWRSFRRLTRRWTGCLRLSGLRRFLTAPILGI